MQRVAVAHFVVVRGELVQELLDAVLFTHAVHVRDLGLRDPAEVQVDLKRREISEITFFPVTILSLAQEEVVRGQGTF